MGSAGVRAGICASESTHGWPGAEVACLHRHRWHAVIPAYFPLEGDAAIVARCLREISQSSCCILQRGAILCSSCCSSRKPHRTRKCAHMSHAGDRRLTRMAQDRLTTMPSHCCAVAKGAAQPMLHEVHDDLPSTGSPAVREVSKDGKYCEKGFHINQPIYHPPTCSRADRPP